MNLRNALTVLGVVAAVGVAAMVGTAYAQTPTPTPAPGQAGASYQQLFLDKLAAALGTTTDKLKAAITQARNDTVDQAVKDGKLTQQQADQIKARSADGHLGFGFGGPGFDGQGRGGPGGPGFAHGGPTLDAVAQALGMTTQDLTTQLRSGKTLADLAKGKEQAVKDAIVNAEKPQLDQAVKNGRITQDRENQILDQIRNSDLSNLHGFGGPGRFGPGAGQNQPPSPAPSSGTAPATPSAS